MSDQRRRDHERRANQGDDQAASQAINERIRAGDLIESRIRLAARLGHVPAKLLFPDEKRAKSVQVELMKLCSYDQGLAKAVCMAVASSILEIWKDGVHTDPRLQGLATLETHRQVLQDFVEAPSVETANAVSVLEQRPPGGIGREHRWEWYIAYTIRTARMVASLWPSLTEACPMLSIRRTFTSALSIYGDVLGHGLPGRMSEQQGNVLCRQFIVTVAVAYLIPVAK